MERRGFPGDNQPLAGGPPYHPLCSIRWSPWSGPYALPDDAMSQARHTFQWRPGDPGGDMRLSIPLERRLEPLREDRTSTAAGIVREASELLRDWLTEVGSNENHALGALLGTALDPLHQVHGWRGPVALWLRTIDRAVRQAGSFRTPLREVLVEEMGLWLGGIDGVSEPDSTEWTGEPLDPGTRLPDRRRCIESLLPEIEPGEVLVVPGFSETVALAIERLVEEGLAPILILGEGGPSLGGRQMVRRLEHTSLSMRLVYDVALGAELPQADRVWLGTEAIGPASMVGLKGTGALLTEARRRQVPCTVFATTDKVMPGARLELPAWAQRESYLLWDGPAEGLTVDAQYFEHTLLDGQALLATEVGLRTPAQLALQALRTDS